MVSRILLLAGPQVRRLCSKPPAQRPWYLTPLDKFERWLETKHPKAYKMQQKVVNGGRHCFADLKVFVRVSSSLKQGKPLDQFTRQELEVYLLTPNDIQKLAVIAFVIALPMTIFILAIALAFFPRLLLTRHFWSLAQTEQFRSIILEKRRLHHYEKIAESLANEIQKLEDSSTSAFDFFQAIKNPPVTLRQLENYAEIIQRVKVDSLPPLCQVHLSRAHGLWTWGWGSNGAIRLRRHAEILAVLDSKLRMEKVDDMTLSDLKQSLYIRQFDILKLTDESERQLLKDWLNLTKRNSSEAVILHSPILTQLHLLARAKPKTQ